MFQENSFLNIVSTECLILQAHIRLFTINLTVSSIIFRFKGRLMPDGDSILSFLEAHLIGGNADYDTVSVSF